MTADLLICGGTVLDGTGKTPYLADIAVQNGKISAIAQNLQMPAGRIFHAEGKYVTPGFIDIHRHADTALYRKDFGKAELAQGLTTVVNGNCGMSVFPCKGENGDAVRAYLAPVVGKIPQNFKSLSEYRKSLGSLPLTVKTLVGMGTVRACVCGYGAGKPTKEQIRKMHAETERALSEGAVGVSLGLGYAPECFSDTEELLDILSPLKNSGVPLTAHIRQEGAGVREAVAEMIYIARKLNTPVEISHMKAIGASAWGKTAPVLLQMLKAAREDGVDIACDVYPYEAGSTQLMHILPPEFKAGGVERLCRLLEDKAARKEMRERMQTGEDFENIYKLVGFSNIRVIGTGNPDTEGKSLSSLAEASGKDAFENLFDLLSDCRCRLGMIDFIVSPEDLETLYSWEMTSVISDSTYPEEGLCHPRVYGAFPHFWRKFCMEKKLLTPAEAVRRMSALPAGRLGLKGKGTLSVGQDADILVFTPENLRATSRYEAPACLASGMELVLSCGKVVYGGD